MSKEQILDLFERAAWTFLQTFIASFVVVIPSIVEAFNVGGLTAVKAGLLSGFGAAVAAGISALKTVFINTASSRK